MRRGSLLFESTKDGESPFYRVRQKVNTNIEKQGNRGDSPTPFYSRHLATPSPVYSNEPENEFICPISKEIMEDPVTVIACGHIFDARSIYEHMFFPKPDAMQDPNQCPCCRADMRIKNTSVFFKQNHSLYNRIQDFVKQKKLNSSCQNSPSF